MNIVIVTESESLVSGGLSRSLRAQVNEFRRRGHQALIAAPRDPESPIQINQPDIVEIPASTSPEASRFGAAAQWFSANSPELDEFRPDVVHAHAPFMAGALAVRIASRYSAPLVFTIHRQSGLNTPYIQMPRALARRFSEELTVGYCRLADVVIAPNGSLAAFVLDYGVENRVEIVPTGVDVDRLSRGSRSRLRQQHRVPDDAFTIGQSGSFDREGDRTASLRFIRRFLHQHDGVHWFFACDVDFADSGLKQLRRSASLSARLHLLPAATADDVADFYASLDAFVDTAVHEEESIELVEALAAGIPAIASCTPENRELIGDELCGRLLHSAGHRDLNAAIESLQRDPASTSRQVSEVVNRSVASYRIDTCCERLLALYAQAIESAMSRDRPTIGDWHTLAQRLSTERRLWRTRGRALGNALTTRRHASRVPVLKYAIAGWRMLRGWTSRRAWSVRLLNLPVWDTNPEEPGLIVLQVDGLSRAHLERALDGGRLPFLRRLLRRESYRIHSMYSGLPSTTPAVLGELFYGVEQAVPAFGFRDHRTGSVVQMFQPGIASTVQQELSRRGLGLLSQGSAYSVIYSGGARESSFCPATTGWRNVEDAAMWRRLTLYLLNLMSLARICVLSGLEFTVGAFNCVRGICAGHDALRELLYIPRRVIINVVLRELLAISVEADATRGVPVIYANFLGYDENAHRRGPGAFFAYYALRGIDRAVKRIWNAAQASERRSYDVWIISDHGQQRTLPYRTPEGRTIVAAVEDLYRSLRADEIRPGARADWEDERVELQRASWLSPPERAHPPSASTASHATGALPTTVAIGPLGYVYWPDPLDDAERAVIAVRIRDEADVPLVMSVLNGTVWAWTKSGRYRLPDEVDHVLPPDHPFLDEVAQDLVRLCFHQDAGQFLISGWRSDGLPLSFVPENGAHGGPGPEEVHAFAVLPADAPMPEPDHQVLRPRALRQLARTTLGRLPPLPMRRRTKPTEIVRIATYNIHSGIGLDGRPSLRRIGRVLAKAAPDIVALQEVDVHHDRTDLAHQAEWIAEMLQMQVLFHPAFEIEASQYGNAILSRFPMQLQRAGSLPSRRGSEPRAALWVQIEIGDKKLQVVTTHLSLSSADRRQQIDELLGRNWLQDPQCEDPVVLCGDLNLMPGSDVYRRLTSTLSDVQASATGHRPLRTWFGPLPLTRIDHMLVGPRIRVKQVQVPRDSLARTASDHLPLIVDLELVPFNDADESELQKDKRDSIKTHS